MCDSGLVAKVMEYAPAVGILLYINWRQDVRLARILDLCIEHLRRDETQA